MAKGTVLIHQERCKGCGLCVAACPQHVLGMSSVYNARGYQTVALDESQDHCTGCAVCAVICPDVVFSVYREPIRRRQPTMTPSVVAASVPAERMGKGV